MRYFSLVFLFATTAYGFSGSGSYLKKIEIHPVVDTSIYADNDQVGNYPIRIPGAMAKRGGAGLVESISVEDRSNQKSALNIWFFQNRPELTSRDNAAFDMTDAASSTAKLLGSVNIPAANYVETSSNAVASVDSSLAVSAAPEEYDIWMVIESKGTPTYGNGGDLTIHLGITQE